MKTSIKLVSIVGIAAVLLVAGLALAMDTPNAQVSDQTPQVGIQDQIAAPTQANVTTDNTNHIFTITVDARVDGRRVPMADALVLVYSVNVTTSGNTTTVVLEKVAEQRTDANGVVVFDLSGGKYLVIANYHGLNGFGKIDLTDDMSREVMLHNWDGEFLNGLEGSKMVAITMEK